MAVTWPRAALPTTARRFEATKWCKIAVIRRNSIPIAVLRSANCLVASPAQARTAGVLPRAARWRKELFTFGLQQSDALAILKLPKLRSIVLRMA